jgi:hypothetical protein
MRQMVHIVGSLRAVFDLAILATELIVTRKIDADPGQPSLSMGSAKDAGSCTG